MDDLISRQAAIDALDFEIVHMTAYCDGKNEGNPLAQYNKGLEDGKKAIEALPPVQLSLEAIVHPQILDDAEKRYLKGVIRPFRDKVLYIIKIGTRDSSKEYISISFVTFDETYLPCFKKGTMYKGMETNRRYTLEELGL